MKNSLFLISILLSIPSLSCADFMVDNHQKPEPPFYGNAQSEDFLKALEGGEELTEEEKIYYSRTLPRPIQNGQKYFRLGFYHGNLKLDDINKTGGADSDEVRTKSYSETQSGMQYAIGQKFAWFRADLEYLANKSITYESNPVYIGGSDNLSSTVRHHTFMFNFYYDIVDFFPFDPYIALGLGLSLNKTQAEATGGADVGNSSNSSFGMAWNIMLGARYRFMPSLEVDFGFRHTALGSNEWKPVSSLTLEGVGKLNTFYLNLNFWF